MIQLPLIPESIITGTKKNCPDCQKKQEPTNNLGDCSNHKTLESEPSLIEDEQLAIMYAKIEELLLTDTFAAQILYEKYRKLAGDIPPPFHAGR